MTDALTACKHATPVKNIGTKTKHMLSQTVEEQTSTHIALGKPLRYQEAYSPRFPVLIAHFGR